MPTALLSFGLILHMVLEMLFEELQDGCHGEQAFSIKIVHNRKIDLLFPYQNICCGHSKEPSQ